MYSTRLLLRVPKGSVRYFTRCSTQNYVAAGSEIKQQAAETLSIPVKEGTDPPPNPKLLNIVNEISHLNLLEVSELSSLLKKTLNLPDAPMMGSFAAMAPSAAVPKDDEEEVAPKKVQTSFKVKLMKYDETQKIALIKEIKKLMENMNLVQAKKFVDSAPTVVKEDISKDEAEKLKEALTKVGAVIEID